MLSFRSTSSEKVSCHCPPLNNKNSACAVVCMQYILDQGISNVLTFRVPFNCGKRIMPCTMSLQIYFYKQKNLIKLGNSYKNSHNFLPIWSRPILIHKPVFLYHTTATNRLIIVKANMCSQETHETSQPHLFKLLLMLS